MDFSILADQERTTEGNTGSFEFHIIGLADLMLDIGNQRIGDSTNATIINRRITPGDMCKLRIYRATDDLNATVFKLFDSLAEGNQFCRADKSKIKRIKEQDNIFPRVIRKRKIGYDRTISQNGCSSKIRGLLSYEYTHQSSPWAIELLANINLGIILLALCKLSRQL